MKKYLLFVALAAFCMPAYAITTPAKHKMPKATEIFIPVGKSGELISLYELSLVKPKELQKLTGKKMKFFDRLGFRAAQKKLRDNIAPDGTLKDRKFQKHYKKMMDGETGFHLGGFALGFFVGLIGVLIAYIINDDKKQNRVKWAWLGLAAAVVLYLLLIVAIL